MKTTTIFLFDIDSVLVQPGGYRHAFWASLNYFTDRMGLTVNLPEAEELEYLESIGVTSEWDMLPICLAMTLDLIFSEQKSLNTIDDLDQLFEKIASLHLPPLRFAYREFFASLVDRLDADITPCESIIHRYREHQADRLFPEITNTRILDQIFEHSRDFLKSRTTKVFQNFILGSMRFQEVYQIPAFLECEAMLMKHDTPLLSVDTKERICQAIAEEEIKAAVYTLRPSYPPREAPIERHGYTPEAEMALELVGLTGIPTISYGRLNYIASKDGLHVESLIKPSSYQALSAILAACSGNELQALERAKLLYFSDRLDHTGEHVLKDADFPGKIHLNVFEDSAIGMKSALDAGKILNAAGASVHINLWGIAENVDKMRALQVLGATVFDNINLAVNAAITEMHNA